MKKIIVLFMVFVFAFIFCRLKVNGLETTSEELRDGYFYETKTSFNDVEYDVIINKICKHDNGYIVVGKVEDNNIDVLHLDFYVTYPYVAYYDETGLVWSKLDSSIGHGEYCDGVFVNNELVAIGSYETGDGVVKILLTRFNNSGNVKARETLDANKTSFGYYLFFENHNFYMVGLTNATHFLVDTNDVVNKIFILKLNENFEKQKIAFIHNSGDSTLLDACMANGEIYLYGRLSGTGDYDIDSIVPVDLLFSIDNSLTNINYTRIIRHKYNQIACNEDDVYVFNSNDDISTFKISEYGVALDFIKTINPFDNSLDTLTGLKVSSSSLHEPVCVYVTSKHGESKESYLSIDFNLIINSQVTRDIETENTALGIFSLDGYYYLFSNNNDSKIVNKLIYIKEEDGICYCNGERCIETLEAINTDVFGTYQQKVTRSYYDLEINTYRDYVVPIVISIKDKSVYDRKIKLEFNGTGYLNNEPIDSGYIVEKEGQYVLEVRGKDGVKYFTFEVKKLTISENSFEVEDVNCEHLKSVGVTTKDSNYTSEEIPNSNISLSKLNNLNNSDNYYIIIVIAVIGILVGLLVPFEKIIKNSKEKKHE